MAVSFNTIPSNIRVPGVYVEIDNTKANKGLIRFATRLMVFGQRLSAGTVAAGVPTLVTSYEQAVTYFGRGSQLANMFKALKLNNNYTESWAIALDDNGSGVAATGTIVVSGTPTEAGTINLYIAGQRLTIGVTTADTASSIATAINAAINAAADLPVTSTVDTATVTIACRHKGLWGNDIDIRTNYRGSLGGEKTPAGVTLTITAMASGTTNPTLQTAIDAMPEEIYDFIVNPYTDSTNLSALKTELTLRWGPLVLLESHAFSAHRATVANLTTLGNSHNSQHLTIMGYNDSPTPPYEWAAAYAAVAAYYLTIDPARPLQTLDLKGVLAPPLTSRFLLSERNILLTDGIATFSVDRDGTVRIERAATTYQLNVASAPDPSYLDTETMATLAYLSQSFRTRMKLKFPRYKIADDGTRVGVGQALVTPRDIRDECIALFGLWEENGLVENVDQFKDDLVVERDGSDPNRVNILLPPDLVNQLRIIATQIQFRL